MDTIFDDCGITAEDMKRLRAEAAARTDEEQAEGERILAAMIATFAEIAH
jgi:hypothetical protein